MNYLFTFFLVLLFACGSSDNTILVSNAGQAQGSFYHIKYLSDYGHDYSIQIDSIFQKVDSSLSIYQSYSLISKLNNKDQVQTDSLFNTVFLASKHIYNQTKGYFDCSISPLVNYYGFYDFDNIDSIKVDSTKVNKIMDAIGLNKINLNGDTLVLPKNMSLDFNAIAQGYTVDLIAQFLLSKGVNNFLVEIGGELLANGLNADNKTWRVGINKPSDSIGDNYRLQAIIELENKALATSGNYRKYYIKDGIKYSHTIDPKTGFPAQNNLLSVSVIHDECMMADAYATAFMVMGVEKTKKFIHENLKIDIYLVYTDKNGNWKTYSSPNMLKRIVD